MGKMQLQKQNTKINIRVERKRKNNNTKKQIIVGKSIRVSLNEVTGREELGAVTQLYKDK